MRKALGVLTLLNWVLFIGGILFWTDIVSAIPFGIAGHNPVWPMILMLSIATAVWLPAIIAIAKSRKYLDGTKPDAPLVLSVIPLMGGTIIVGYYVLRFRGLN
jgi:hypothetical protein